MHSPTLKELPPPPPNKTGWPWTAAASPLSDQVEDGVEWPRISIVTPSYNQGQFLEETIRSILLQGYPNLEYIIIDGGSTDNSLEIIKKYEPWLTYWVSEPDKGPASAINKGLQKCTGEWFNWINSDDLLLPKSLLTLASIAELVPTATWISGGRLDITEDGQSAGFTIPWLTDPMMIAFNQIYLPQDATFIRLDFLKETFKALDTKDSHLLNEDLQNIFDTLLYFELAEKEPPLLTNTIFSMMRWHKAQRTANVDRRVQETDYYLKRYTQPKSLLEKVIFRLIRTRYHAAIRSLITFGLTLGFPRSAQKWTCCCYIPVEYRFEICPVYQWIMSVK